MFITITITTPFDKNDIQIDCRKKIVAAQEMLISTRKSTAPLVFYYRSKMQKRLVSANNTFLDEDICSGDELTAIMPMEA